MIKLIIAKWYEILLQEHFLELGKISQRPVSHTYIRATCGIDVPVNTHT